MNPDILQTDLARHISQTPIMDTHEHLNKEADYLADKPDILRDLFDNYVTADLVVAGASPEAVARLIDSSDSDVKTRFATVQTAWEACQFTGYGEATRLIAAHFYGLDALTPAALEAARPKAALWRQPGARLRMLHDEANLDHIQVDDFGWTRTPDVSGPDFFLYDLSWLPFCCGRVNVSALHAETGVEVRGLDSLDDVMTGLFAKYAPLSIAVKSQHAYNRTLRWQERTAADVEPVLQKVLAGQEMGEAERNVLGDWCWARGVELATAHNLPFKIHTGYYAGHSSMPVDRIRSGHLCALLQRYPQARFVLMHIAYPYNDELVAIAKHDPNVFVDMCWAWSVNPYVATDFVRAFVHAVPANKLFGFGGDSFRPHASLAYSVQMRRGLTRALQGEIADGLLTERDAMALATRFLRGNQEACFDLAGTRAAIHAAL